MKKIGGRGTGENAIFAGLRLANRVFERPNGGGADSNDAARTAECLIDGFGGGGGDGIGLGVNPVIFYAGDADWLKGSEADVEGDFGGFDSAQADAMQYLRSEVKSGGGRGDGTARLGVNGLVALAIGGGVRSRNVRRQGNVTDAIESCEKIRDRMKTDVALPEFGPRQNFGLQFVLLTKIEAFADADFASGAYKALPFVGVARQFAG